MTVIGRDPERAAACHYDLIIVGGGVYGCSLLLEASRRGMQALLLERDDFGGATTWNSLRIIHGGLRYLQTANLRRFRRSVREQAWWLHHFREFVEPLPCLMPLYQRGLRRKAVMQLALQLNDWLARSVRGSVGDGVSDFEKSGVIELDRVVDRFPRVPQQGLVGAATWSDLRMMAPQRLLVELLRWALSSGGRAVNYMECVGLARHDGKPVVQARCKESHRDYEFMADQVVNCAGPWTSELVAQQGLIQPDDRGSCVAFNLLVNRRPLANEALALTPDRPSSQTLFFLPHGEHCLVGTAYLSRQSGATPDAEHIAAFLRDVNAAVGDWDLSTRDVVEVLPGRLPARSPGSRQPAATPKMAHHVLRRGEKPCVTSVVGEKLTTARFMAEATLRRISRIRRRPLPPYQQSAQPAPSLRPNLFGTSATSTWSAHDLQKWVAEESVLHVDDLLIRRCDPIGVPTARRLQVAANVMDALGWDASHQQRERARLECASTVDT